MSTRSKLWLALFIRWFVISFLCLLASWLYNNDDPFWHMHVTWVSTAAIVMFWVVQVLHIVYLAMLAWVIYIIKHESEKST